MFSIKKIVAAVDRSPHADQVVTYAIDVAARTGADLDLLRVEVIHEERLTQKEVFEWKNDVHKLLQERDATWITVQYITERAITPAPGIVKYAADVEAGMIVIGTHGRRGFRAFMLGSVAQEVIRTAPCPVFTVSAMEERHLEIGRSNRILVPLDFSKYSIAALKYARELADTIGATVEIVHVVEDTFHPAFYGPFYQSIYDVIPEIEDVSRRNIIKLLDQTGGYAIQTKIDVFKGHPARDIPKFAQESGVELIVMATHGLTGLDHLFMGSVAERTAQQARCPVLTIRVDQLPSVEEGIEYDFEDLAVI
ncbi:MAG: universal stress protein [Rhodothermia bacterium]|nr:MAG: universal stress protein [Rhodothermia bacterium]